MPGTPANGSAAGDSSGGAPVPVEIVATFVDVAVGSELVVPAVSSEPLPQATAMDTIMRNAAEKTHLSEE